MTRAPTKTRSIPSLEDIRLLPKADLHVHLEGTVSLDLLKSMCAEDLSSLEAPVELPSGTKVAVPPYILEGEQVIRSFDDFIAIYLKITQSISRSERLVMIGDHYLSSAKQDGVRFAELYFSPSTHLFFGRSLEEIFSGLLEIERIGAQVYNIGVSWIFDIVRNMEKDGMRILDLVIKARERGLTMAGLGMAGKEEGFPSKPFAPAFARARNLGLKTMAHSGEYSGWQAVAETLSALSPNRIGHGISSIENADLVERLKRERVTIEVCPWSNIILGLKTAHNHPLPQMLEAGLDVVLGSDDPGIFGKTLSGNYMLALEMGVSWEDVKRMAGRSVEVGVMMW